MKGRFSLLAVKRKLKTKNLGLFFIFFACLLLSGLFLFLFYLLPGMGMGPEQPIAFSHRVHAGVKNIQCEFCHSYVSRSEHPGIPPVEKCLYCHNHIISNHPEIKKEHQYFNTKTSTPWVKVNYIPEHVFFIHQRHIKKQVECTQCHGEVAAMDRLKGTRFKMQFCIDCHKIKGANLDCWLGCHN
ncbi:MAG: cytochrome c3 family protein [Desulfobacteraceae bacterium]|nr:cytochrome c3 family protein [Desulfobacteraceae bacterium]MBU4001839.1 cytochrome c family protein [Pseudomonadota bacterium]MBU4053714.1 cytochrome c family protein [Pseudomonadota bacterium]